MTAAHDAAARHGNFFITDMSILRVVAPHFRSPHAPAALLSRLVHWQAINERNGVGIDEDGVCWTYASDVSWEADCGISRGQAHRFIATFVELGWVRQQLASLGDHPRLVSWYHVDFDAIPDDPGVPRGTAVVTRAVPRDVPRGTAVVTRAESRGLHIKEKEREKNRENNARAPHDLDAFEELWTQYRRLSVWGPVGTRAAAWKAWCKLSPADRKRAVDNFQTMVEMKRPTRERAPHASTYLGKSEKGFTCYDDGAPVAAESTELFVDEVLSYIQPDLLDIGEVHHEPR